MFRFALTLFLFVFTMGVKADVFQCTDKSGAVTFRDTPCAAVEKKDVIEKDYVAPQYNPDANSEYKDPQTIKPSKPLWDYNFVKDDLTGESHWILFSQPTYVNSTVHGVELNEIDIRVLQSGILIINAGMNGTFSTNVAGLGLKVGDNKFVRVKDKMGSRSLAFDKETSKILIEQMKSSGSVKGRVAFFPYEDVDRDFEISLSGFTYANEMFNQCLQRNSQATL